MKRSTMGSTTRRAVLKATLVVGSVSLAAGAAAADERVAQQKIAQKIVQYQDHPKNKAQCDNCTNFVAPNACKIVDGTISPEGWCVAYAPKQS